MNLAGKFIVIDGPDGAGKGTQLQRLEDWLTAAGLRCIRAKDPGGTPIGDRIRHVVLGYDLAEMAPRCEALLFMASRAQLVAQVVRPALAAGQVVLCDRFISATCAYQVAAGFPRDEVITLGRFAVGDTWPDLTLILDVPADVGLMRAGRPPQQSLRRPRGDDGQLAMFADAIPDAMERRPLDYHRQVRDLFLDLHAVYPAPVAVIDASHPPEVVFASMLEALRRAFV